MTNIYSSPSMRIVLKRLKAEWKKSLFIQKLEQGNKQRKARQLQVRGVTTY